MFINPRQLCEKAKNPNAKRVTGLALQSYRAQPAARRQLRILQQVRGAAGCHSEKGCERNQGGVWRIPQARRNL